MASATNQGQAFKDKARDTASNVADKARDTASGLTDKARDVASNVADKATDMAHKAADKASEYGSAIGDKATNAVETVGSSMKTVAGSLRENLPNKGMLGGASESVASALESGGRYLEEKGLSGVGSEVTDMIKRHPVPSVLLALGLGYLIACSTRS